MARAERETETWKRKVSSSAWVFLRKMHSGHPWVCVCVCVFTRTHVAGCGGGVGMRGKLLFKSPDKASFRGIGNQ